MSTTEQLKRTVAPAKARASAVAATNKTGTMLDIVRSKSFQAQMALALPKSMTAERLTRIVMTECRKVPALMQCNQESFFGAVLQCAQLGLEPGSALGHCYLLPFGNGKSRDGRPNCQLIIGYRGMIDFARRSGQIVSINAYCVHEADEFEYELGLHPDIHHRPSPLAERGPVTYVYAVAVLKGGGVQFEVMSRAEIEAVRLQSKAGKSGPGECQLPPRLPYLTSPASLFSACFSVSPDFSHGNTLSASYRAMLSSPAGGRAAAPFHLLTTSSGTGRPDLIQSTRRADIRSSNPQ